ncbi:MAG: flagellar biosynthetic protein FliQ [Bdellovibrionota bacterium]
MIEQAFKHGLFIVLIVSAVPLLAASCGGLLISVIQAATQIQEQTVTYFIKFIILSVVIAFGWDWFSNTMVALMQDLLTSISMVN